jgi:hypothetical protein
LAVVVLEGKTRAGLIFPLCAKLLWSSQFVLVDRRTKIESGERTTSFSFLLNDKHGAIGRALVKTRPERRAAYFMGGQFCTYLQFSSSIIHQRKFISVYSILTELPAVYLLYDSPRWSGSFLILIFAVSVWNGGGFYIEVFGRKYVQFVIVFPSSLTESCQSDLNAS